MRTNKNLTIKFSCFSFLFLWKAYRAFYLYHILLLNLFHFQLFLHQAVGNSFQVTVISISFLAKPINGFLVTPDVEHVIQPRMVFASHPPHERMTRNFKASSAYWRLDCQSLILPQMERPHTTPMPTKRENTLLDRMSKQCRWICSCGSSVRSSEFRTNISFNSRNKCRILFDA